MIAVLSLLKLVLRAVVKFMTPAIFYLKGRTDAENKAHKKQRKERKDVRKIHDRVRNDKSYRERLRDRYKQR